MGKRIDFDLDRTSFKKKIFFIHKKILYTILYESVR